MKVLAKTYYCPFIVVLTYMVIYVAIQCINPYLTALMMNYISHKEDYDSSYGWFLFSLILFLQIVKALLSTQMTFSF
jgi:hypothetical protein